ncbi:hypothetical protein MNBD_PLANCTO02-1399 [hydrothermal vent metagenome]|uniref:Uncharacterized protein n=1 Tax=hydrothermal vent metagenome TaxID=652676 RepID=A0A3B1DWV3_9ZZZZ
MDYRLKQIGKTCAATGQPLEPGSVCYSVLVEKEEQLARLDFSEEGWKGPPEGAIGYWKMIVPEEENQKQKSLDADALLLYFEQLCEDANPANEKFCYVLSLLLLQKRKLRIEGEREENGITFLQMAGIQGEGPYDVRVLDIPDDEVVQLQQSLNQHAAIDAA